MKNALISIKPKYVQSMLDGKKCIELRSRSVNLRPGTRLWIYSTLPKGCIEATAIVEDIYQDSPAKIWKKYSKDINIKKYEFDKYVHDRLIVTAIKLNHINQISPAPSLHLLRKKVKNFCPPQFFIKLTEDHPILSALLPSLTQEMIEAAKEY